MHSLYNAPAVAVRQVFSAYLLFIFFLTTPCVVHAQRSIESQPISVAVIYPSVAPPYNAVLSQIISGINQQAGISLKEYPLNDEYDSAALRKKLEEQDTEVIIALGRRGTEAVHALRWGKPVIVGAASLTSSLLNTYGDSLSAIRLTPDPDLLFAKLREFSRKSKRIIVVTNTSQGRAEAKGSSSAGETKAAAMEETWLLDAARESAKKYDFELLVYPATDLRMVANFYRKIMDGMQPGTDALWLPPDDESIDIRGILPAILQGAWDRRIIVFSSNPAYAKRGALFALYPDNAKTGQRLAALAIDAIKNGRARILPTQEVLTAVNMRTAEHLRLRELAQKQQYFDAVYPSP